MAGKAENKVTTEGVETPSVNTVEVATVEKSMYDQLAAETSQRIEKLEAELEAKNEKITELETSLKTANDYAEQLEENFSGQIVASTGEYDHIPLVNIIDGKKYSREEVVADKKLLKLFK